ncbi:hypothetical protein FQA39_LY07586 [Lamprigera yunnana]|nr:hypothetical protein FQA39_LY07586 [Lamprigera yunnana]
MDLYKKVIGKMKQIFEMLEAPSTKVNKLWYPDGTSFYPDDLQSGPISREKIIFNCSKHAEFIRDNVDCTISSNSNDFNEEDNVPLSVWAKAIDNQLLFKNEELEQYIIGDAVATCEELSDENFVQNITIKRQENDDDNDEMKEICSNQC